MRMSTMMVSAISAWIMAVVYDWIEVTTGMEIRPILYVAVLVMATGLYLGCRNDKETARGEA